MANDIADQQRILAFLKSLGDEVQKDAPKWSSDPQPPYNFEASKAYARTHFPVGCDLEFFVSALTTRARQALNSQCYTDQAYGAWELGVLADVLLEQGQDDIVLDRVVPQLWEDMGLKKVSLYAVADFLNPAILDVLQPSAARSSFLSRIVDLLLDPQCDVMRPSGQRDNDFISQSVAIAAHLGAYNLEAPKTEIAIALVDRVGPQKLIGRCYHNNHISLMIGFLTSVLKRVEPATAKDIVGEIQREMPPDVFRSEMMHVFDHSYPRLVHRFFPLFMKHLPEESQEAYGAAVVKALGPQNLLSTIHRDLSWSGVFNHDVRGFIDAFPLKQAQGIVVALTEAALARDYEVSPDVYHKTPDPFWYHSKNAISLHDIVPPKCLEVYELCILHALEQENRPSYAMMTAAILLRGSVTRDGQVHRTQEVDFYPNPTSGVSGALAHLKPFVGQNTPSMIAADDFVGTLEAFFNSLAHPTSGAPRWLAPSEKSIHKKYAQFSEALKAADEAARQGHEMGLPSLTTFIRSRHSRVLGLFSCA